MTHLLSDRKGLIIGITIVSSMLHGQVVIAEPLGPVDGTQIHLPLLQRAFDPNIERQILLNNVVRVLVPSGSVPGPIALFEDQAFPVVVGRIGKDTQATLMAASTLGVGRVVAFGHPSYFGASGLIDPNVGQLILNAVRWSTNQLSPTVLVYQQPDLLAFLNQHGIPAQAINLPLLPSKLSEAHVLALDPAALTSQGDFDAVNEFAKVGGGLLTVGLGWGWQYLNPGRSLARDHTGNRLLASAGIAWAEGYFEQREFAPQIKLTITLNAVYALRHLSVASDESDVEQSLASVYLAIPVLPDTNVSLLPTLLQLKTLARTIIPTAEAPFIPAQSPPQAVGFRMLAYHEPVEQVIAHPAGSNFPGAVPSTATRLTRTISIDTSKSGWHSTGLYAAPGEKITIETGRSITVTLDLMARIGVHTGALWNNDVWKRAPQIDRIIPLSGTRTSAANPFGGLIYLVVPAGVNIGIITATITGGVDSPRFVMGETDLDTWRTQIRNYPAPWAELQSSSLILTIQSEWIRALDNPQDVLAFWERVQDANLNLAGWAAGRNRPMRIAFDRQLFVSGAYMYAGYPIMAWLSSQSNALKIAAAPGGAIPDDAWGFFHELGHNHQNLDWTFDGTTEVTVNLFTMYAIERVLNLPKEKGGPDVTPERQAELRRAYFCAGAPFEEWKKQPFLALGMYIQLIDAFGWDSFKTVFRNYLALAESERPKTDDQKRDQWLVRYSGVVGRNLGPFFDAWGVPVSPTAKQSIVHLPTWLPAPNFPNNIACAN